jgi:type II secretory pathway pseudopilin PulG
MRRPSGITLVEAAVAIAVVATLAGILVPLTMEVIRDARIARAKADLKIIAAALALQLKDTGCRPRANQGAGGDGAQPQGIWLSAGAPVTVWNQANPAAPWGLGNVVGHGLPNNTFANLFTAGPNDAARYQTANALFGLNVQPGAERAYRGPYLAPEVASKTDPWGRSYMIFGYSYLSQRAGRPIYVVCAGESGRVIVRNFRWLDAAGAIARPRPWSYDGPGRDNLVVEVDLGRRGISPGLDKKINLSLNKNRYDVLGGSIVFLVFQQYVVQSRKRPIRPLVH